MNIINGDGSKTELRPVPTDNKKKMGQGYFQFLEPSPRILFFLLLFSQDVFAKTQQVAYTAADVAKATDIRDIKDPFLLISNYSILLFTLLFCVFAVIVFFIVKKILKIIKKEQEKHIDPFDYWFEKLKTIHEQGLFEKGMIKEFYTDISDILRHYLEYRFRINAPEMTTEEFIYKLKNSDIVKKEHKEMLKEFLEHCDMVKFAKYGPDKQETEDTYESAVKVFQETKPVSDDCSV